MSEKSKPENKEATQKVELKVVEPIFDKNFMVGFTGKTENECRAYNWAISTTLKEENLDPFHQIGTTLYEVNEPGYHAWEIWRKATKEQLEELLPKIKEKAEEYLRDMGEQ